MKNTILQEIIDDLDVLYKDDDDEVLESLLEDVIRDALFISNRQYKKDSDNQLRILKSNIKKAVKTIYLQRGAEDVMSEGLAGISSTYGNAIEMMEKDILRQNKRLFI